MPKLYRNIRARPVFLLFVAVCSCLLIVRSIWYDDSDVIRRMYHSGSADAQGLLQTAGSIPAQNVTTVSWMDKRTAALTQGGPTKLLVLGYTKAGLDIIGSSFNQDRSASVWFEPGAAFYTAYFGVEEENFSQHDLYFSNMTRRISSDIEQRWMADYYKNLWTCQYDTLPPEALGHWFVTKSAAMSEYRTCMGPNLERDYSLNKCIRLIAPICGMSVQSSLQEKCHLVIATTRIVFQENQNLFQEMLHSTNNLFEFNAYTYQMVSLLSDQLNNIGFVSELVLSRLRWFVQHRLCIEMVRIFNNNCLEHATIPCREKDIHAVEVSRLTMENVEPLLQANPDLFVVHLVRDPRATAMARADTKYLLWDSLDKRPVVEAKLLCHQMVDDLRQRRLLNEKYPGVFHQMRYEDLIYDPVQTVTDMYAKFGREVPQTWGDYSKQLIQKIKATNPVAEAGTAEENADPNSPSEEGVNSEPLSWIKRIPPEQMDDINNFCNSIIVDLDYPIS